MLFSSEARDGELSDDLLDPGCLILVDLVMVFEDARIRFGRTIHIWKELSDREEMFNLGVMTCNVAIELLETDSFSPGNKL